MSESDQQKFASFLISMFIVVICVFPEKSELMVSKKFVCISDSPIF